MKTRKFRFAALAGMCLAWGLTLAAQHTRTVTGTVLDSRENPIAGAIVYLKNDRSRAVRTYISDDHGRYVFHALAPNTDYSLHATYRGKSSSQRLVSSFDSQQTIHITLKIPL